MRIRQPGPRGVFSLQQQLFISNEIAGFVLEKVFLRGSGGACGMASGVAAAALVFERTAAGAGGVASHILALAYGLGGRFRGLRDLMELQVAVETVELDLGDGSFADAGALCFDEFDDLHGGFESDGGRSLLVTQNVSKSVECEVGEAAEFV